MEIFAGHFADLALCSSLGWVGYFAQSALLRMIYSNLLWFLLVPVF
jgi:hypothetical protein